MVICYNSRRKTITGGVPTYGFHGLGTNSRNKYGDQQNQVSKLDNIILLSDDKRCTIEKSVLYWPRSEVPAVTA